MFGVCCLIFGDCLFVCLLRVACDSLFVDRRVFVVVVFWLLCGVCCLLSVVCWFVVRCLLLVVVSALFVGCVRGLLCVVCRSLFVVCR